MTLVNLVLSAMAVFVVYMGLKALLNRPGA